MFFHDASRKTRTTCTISTIFEDSIFLTLEVTLIKDFISNKKCSAKEAVP